jgi:protein KRI1
MGFKHKRKAEAVDNANRMPLGVKKSKVEDAPAPAPAAATEPKKMILDDSDSEDSADGGAPVIKVNEEFAKKFEHNKKREELSRLEEKFKSQKDKAAKGVYGDKYDEDSEDSEDDEDEDDEGFLVTEDLDAEISATLQAIRNKDPRVYDEKITFYKPLEETLPKGDSDKPKEKPMYLQDYHRENLLKLANGEVPEDADMEDAPAPLTFAQEQEQLKKTLVGEMHAAAGAASDDDDEDGGFLIPKSKPATKDKEAKAEMHPSRKKNIKIDPAAADKDPETFLSNFMAARAWVPGEGTKWTALESDDDEELEKAEEFEHAFNLRFEDPTKSNEILKSYARDIIAEKSVRREEPKARKKAREAERERKEREKQEREAEKARLRKLRIDAAEEKLKKIKKAAGLSGKKLKDAEWVDFLENDWSDDQWDREMAKRFGEDYYAEKEAGNVSGSDEEEAAADGKMSKKVKKPKWDDDIDINDIIPDFVDEEEPAVALEDLLSDAENSDDDVETAGQKKTSKDRKKEAADKKKAARLERKKIEDLVDKNLDLDLALPSTSSKSKAPTRFRYRETSPTSFGLTARDILMAPDTALNEFVGLKKMATFRDAEKKRKDKKRLGKKARLREWRRETFGNEEGPEIVIGTKEEVVERDGEDNVVEGKRKKKRSKKNKGGAEA